MNINNNEKYREKEYKWIYNKQQALFFIQEGCDITPRDIDINDRTGYIFFKFKNNEKLQQTFDKWLSLKSKTE